MEEESTRSRRVLRHGEERVDAVYEFCEELTDEHEKKMLDDEIAQSKEYKESEAFDSSRRAVPRGSNFLKSLDLQRSART